MIKVCKTCGVTFNKRREQIFCSIGCATAHTNRVHRSGENHYLYKGEPRAKECPIKKSARYKVYCAVKAGELIRQPCEVCGDSKSEGHHKDYTKPLEVEWLCRKHHKLADIRDGHNGGDFGNR